MTSISKKEYSRYFFILFFLILLVLAFILIRPFITPLLLSIIIAYSSYPLYNKLNKLIKNRSLCSVVMVILLFLIIAIPFFVLVRSLLSEAGAFYNSASKMSISLSVPLKEIIQKGLSGFISEITPSLTSLKNTSISFFILLFSLFYFFKDGENIIRVIEKKIPLKRTHKRKLMEEFKQVTSAVIYGLVFVGIIEGIIGATGFYLLGIPSPLFWGLIITILAILPVVGPPLIWIPMSVMRFVGHDYTAGALIVILGLVLGAIDLILKPKLIGKKARIHPLVTLVGVFGGLKIVGITGIIFGPLILVMTITLINFITKTKK